MITHSSRNVFVGLHVTEEQKELLRSESERRHISMSALIAQIIEQWLSTAVNEYVEPTRSNKRSPFNILVDPPDHIHTYEEDGRPTCGCKYEEEIPLPLEAL